MLYILHAHASLGEVRRLPLLTNQYKPVLSFGRFSNVGFLICSYLNPYLRRIYLDYWSFVVALADGNLRRVMCLLPAELTWVLSVVFRFSCFVMTIPIPHDFLNLRFPLINPCNPVDIHPGRLTWNLRIHPWKRKIIFQTIIFRFDSLIFGGVSSWSIKIPWFSMVFIHPQRWWAWFLPTSSQVVRWNFCQSTLENCWQDRSPGLGFNHANLQLM